MITEFPLFLFTTLGGLGAGLYVVATLAGITGKKRNIAVSLVPLVALAIGGVALMLHLGHPERILNILGNPFAGITQEGIATGAFGLMLLIDLICSFRKGETPYAVRIIGSVFALVLCLIMGNAYFAYESMPVWHAAGTFLLFLFPALAAGASLLAFVDKDVSGNRTYFIYCAVMYALSVVTFIVECALFAANGLAVAPFVLATVLAVVSLACPFVRRNTDVTWRRWVICVAIVVALVVARYAFYAIL